MRKSVLLVAVVLMSMIWGSLLIADDEVAEDEAAAEDMCVPMGDITLSPLVEEGKRSDVEFPHAVHFGYSCQECHHTWEGTEEVLTCTTSGCHDLAVAPKDANGKLSKDPELKIRYYKAAYHDMCIGCHKSIKKSNKAIESSRAALGQKLASTGPTGCNLCHPKE